jgi:hypothetical protein
LDILKDGKGKGKGKTISVQAWTGFDPGQLDGRFVLQNVPMGQNFVRMCLFPVVSIISPLLGTQLRAALDRMAAS